MRDRRQGSAAILYVDRVLVRTVDNYAPNPTYDVQRLLAGLADGRHALRIVVLGEGLPAAKADARFVVTA